MPPQTASSLLETQEKACRKRTPSDGKQSPSIILVERHLLMRQALQHAVSTFFQKYPAVSFRALSDLLTTIEEITAHTIVLGPSIPLFDCFSLLKQLCERCIRCNVVVIQQDLHPEVVRMLIEQGVRGLLDEGTSERELAQAISAASHGRLFLSPRLSAMRTAIQPGTKSLFTGREIQVLTRLKYGESNARIASMLELKEKTIEKYLTTIYDKLHVRSRAEALLCLQKLHL